MMQQQGQPPQAQVNPNIVPQFRGKSFAFKLDAKDNLVSFEPKAALDWLNDQIMAGWQLYELNKLYQDGCLLIFVVVVKGTTRKILPVKATNVPTVYRPGKKR